MSRHAVLFVVAVLSAALVATPAQALSPSGAESLSLFARIEVLVKLLFGEWFAIGQEVWDASPTKANDIIEPIGTSDRDGDPPLDGIGDVLEPNG